MHACLCTGQLWLILSCLNNNFFSKSQGAMGIDHTMGRKDGSDGVRRDGAGTN